MRYAFGDYVIDIERVELRHGGALVAVEPQVFELLVHLIRNQDRVVGNEELFDTVWKGRVVSLSTLTSRINAAHGHRRRRRDAGADQDRCAQRLQVHRCGLVEFGAPEQRQDAGGRVAAGGTREQMDWFNELQRKTTSPENAVRIRLISDYLNVVDLLPRVTTPTLVLHCRDDAIQPFEEGRLITANIPGARFVGLEGRNHLILETDPGWPVFQAEVRAFLDA